MIPGNLLAKVIIPFAPRKFSERVVTVWWENRDYFYFCLNCLKDCLVQKCQEPQRQPPVWCLLTSLVWRRMALNSKGVGRSCISLFLGAGVLRRFSPGLILVLTGEADCCQFHTDPINIHEWPQENNTEEIGRCYFQYTGRTDNLSSIVLHYTAEHPPIHFL